MSSDTNGTHSGFSISFLDTELPLSYDYVQFMHNKMLESEADIHDWYNQHKETNHCLLDKDRINRQDKLAKDLIEKEPEATTEMITLVYSLFRKLVLGNLEAIKVIDKIAPVFVVGLPRSGGTYVTKQLYKGLHIDYKQVSSALGHDGMPGVPEFTYDIGKQGEVVNRRTHSYLSIAEFIIMASDYYSHLPNAWYADGRLVFPKKLCNLIYDYNLFKYVFPHAKYIVTYRSPLGFLGSIMDKAKKKDPLSPFSVDLVIEQWADSLVHSSNYVLEKESDAQYYKIMLEYHRLYYQRLAASGILSDPSVSIVEFGPKMKRTAEEILGVDADYENFHVSQGKSFPAPVLQLGRKIDLECRKLLGLKK